MDGSRGFPAGNGQWFILPAGLRLRQFGFQRKMRLQSGEYGFGGCLCSTGGLDGCSGGSHHGFCVAAKEILIGGCIGIPGGDPGCGLCGPGCALPILPGGMLAALFGGGAVLPIAMRGQSTVDFAFPILGRRRFQCLIEEAGCGGLPVETCRLTQGCIPSRDRLPVLRFPALIVISIADERLLS